MLTRWDPFRDMMSFREAMDRMMEDTFRTGFMRTGAMGVSVPIDVVETEDSYTLKAALPGIRPEDVSITSQGSTITIQGEIREETEGQKATEAQGQRQGGDGERSRQQPSYLMRERHWGRFMRSVTLPSDAQMDRVEAQFENGVLTLTVPKMEEAKPRHIPIRGFQQRTPIEGRPTDQGGQQRMNA